MVGCEMHKNLEDRQKCLDKRKESQIIIYDTQAVFYGEQS